MQRSGAIVLLTLLSACATTYSPPPAAAQQESIWRDRISLPRNPNAASRMTAGQALENSFGIAFSTCGITRFMERYGPLNTRRRDLTRIPQVFQNNLDLADSVRRLRPTSLARALSYVAPLDTADPALVLNPDQSRHMRIEPRLAPGLMIPEGDPRLVFTNSCGTTTKMAASLSINVEPVADAAFNAMRNSQTDVSIAVAAGPFVSPIAAMLDSAGAEGFYARQIVWDWYSRNADAVRNSSTSGGVYRALVNGIVISRVFTDRVESSLKASAEGSSGPLSFVSLNAEAQSAIVHNQSASVERYEIWEFTRAADTTLIDTLPTPVELNQEMQRRLHADLRRNTEDVVQSIPYTHTFVIDGFHPNLCNDGSWAVGGAYASSLSRSIRPDTPPAGASGRPWIRWAVEITFRPTDELWNNPHSRDWTLEYDLVNTVGRGTDTAQLTLPFKVDVHLIDNPVVRQFRPAAEWNRIDPDTVNPQTVTWTGYQIHVIEDSRNLVQWVNFGPRGLRAVITCPKLGDAATVDTVPVTVIGTPSRDPNTGVLSFQLQAPFPADASPSLARARQCTLGGTIEFLMGVGGIRVTKPLPTSQISYPGAQL